MNLSLVGINFKSAPLAVRERATYTAEKIPNVLQRFQSFVNGAEIALLSTCNRTELYIGGTDKIPNRDVFIENLVRGSQSAELDILRPLFYEKHGKEAAEHLMMVTASLDSLVVGETEILGQVKQAYALASNQKTLGKTLNQVFQFALRIAKRVHTETDICRGRLSVSSIAVEFAEKVFEDLSTKTSMIIGAGRTAELALEQLVNRGIHDVIVVNRTIDKAKILADKYGGKAIQLELVNDYVKQSDVVISSVAETGYILKYETMKTAINARRGRPILLIDIALPRNVHPNVGKIPGVYLYHIDDLKTVAEENLARRQESVDNAKEIIRLGVNELTGAFKTEDIRRLIAQLDQVSDEYSEETLKKILSNKDVLLLPSETKDAITNILKVAFSEILEPPRKALQSDACRRKCTQYAEVTKDLFALDCHYLQNEN